MGAEGEGLGLHDLADRRRDWHYLKSFFFFFEC